MDMTKAELEKKLAELEAENAELRSKPEVTSAVTLPDPKFTPTIPYQPKKKVTIRLFKDDYRYKEPLFVGINGRTFMIPRGRDVEVDDYVAAFIAQQKAEEEQISRRVEQDDDEYNKATAQLG